MLTGRVADPSIFMAPMLHEFGWDPLDHVMLGRGNGIGHLMECGAQVTGGYFCDPGFKDVPEPWNLAFPICEVEPDGSAVITKVAGTGGAVDRRTVKEQLFYEVHDPANYLTPDVTVDFTTAVLEEVGPDRVRVTNLGGKPRPPTLKVSIGCIEGFIGEDMFFYAGPGRPAPCPAGAHHPRGALQDRGPPGLGVCGSTSWASTPSTAMPRPPMRPSPTRWPCASPPAPPPVPRRRRSAARSTAWRSPASA